ncbi:MAG: hypothetical protein IT174_09800 [Acidobacteria bacterium]|nr:hypothetical protein [Acidobacteriota bacterium]
MTTQQNFSFQGGNKVNDGRKDAETEDNRDESMPAVTPDTPSDIVSRSGSDSANIGGITKQILDPEAIEAGQTGAAGGDSDLMGGVANLDELTEAAVEQNEYNR